MSQISHDVGMAMCHAGALNTLRPELEVALTCQEGGLSYAQVQTAAAVHTERPHTWVKKKCWSHMSRIASCHFLPKLAASLAFCNTLSTLRKQAK